MDFLSRLQSTLGEDQSPEATPPRALVDLQPRLVRFLPQALQRRLQLDADPLPDPELAPLIDAASALRSLYHSLTTYVPRCLVERVEERPAPGHPQSTGHCVWAAPAGGTFLEGTVLFADISGFTLLSEKLGQQGPAGTEELTAIVNRYFGEMLDILARSGGDLLKFAGDAVLAYFPAFARGSETEADWAIRAGLRMQRAMVPFQAVETSQGTFPLRMKVGLASGRFLAAQVGTAERMEFVVTGPAIQSVMAAEDVAESGQVIIAPTTRQRAGSETRDVPHRDGFFAVDADRPFELGDFEIRAGGRRRGAFLPARRVPALLRQIGEELDRLEALAPYLAPELVDKLVAGGKRRRVESEYRTTTVLFGNFTGPEDYFAALADREDGAQVLASVLDHYFTPVQQIIASHGGIISRIDPYSQGSKLLALFGAPVAHEDDPQRAVAAALAIRERLPAIDAAARSTLARHGIPVPADAPVFGQRAGITLGLTFAGEAGSRNRREYTVMGDEVNLAARLMAASQPGQILLSRRVQERAGPRFLLRALDPIRVKGKSQPIPIFEARGRRRITPVDVVSQVPLCGRHEEMKVAQEALDDVIAGRGRVLILEGRAGVGKTRLAREIAAQATARGGLALWGTAVRYGDAPPYAPWREILADLLQITPGTRIVELENRLRALGLRDDTVRLALADVLGINPLAADAFFASVAWAEAEAVPERGIFHRVEDQLLCAYSVTTAGTSTALNLWVLASERAQEDGEARLGTLDAQVSVLREQRTRIGLTTLLERCAAQAPLLLVFEDAHWMDDASWALLEDLIPRLVAGPVLTLVLTRSGPSAVGGQRSLAKGVEFQLLQLSNLEPAATAALAQALLGVTDLPASVADLVYARSQGNPLFVEELVHALREQGCLAVDPASGQLAVQRDLHTVAVPTTVSGVILSRIDRLPAGEQRVLKSAAVIGREFLYDVLRHLPPQTMPSDVLDGCLASLVRDHFIVELDADPHQTFAFLHGLTQEVAYESLPLAERRPLHRAIGEQLETLFADELIEHCEELAAHFCHGEVPDKAAIYLLMAGDKARDQGAYDEAGHYYRAALDVGDKDPHRAAHAHEGRGDVLMFQAEYEPAVAAYGQALKLQPADDVLVARVQGKRGLLSPLAGRADGDAHKALWVADLEAGIAGFQAQGTGPVDAERCVSLMGCRAWHAWQSGDAETASHWCDKALALPGVSEPVQALARYVRGLALGAGAATDLEAARRVWLTLGDADAVALADVALSGLIRGPLSPADSAYTTIFRLAAAPWL